MRIIAGELRGRKLGFPEVLGLRPTADRIRETLFNWIQEQVPGETCLDMYAGSGAMGFEALSRGAAKVVFIEKNPKASRSIAEHIELLEIKNGTVIRDNALYWLAQHADVKEQFGLVFLDPPFQENLIYTTSEQLQSSGILKNDCRIYIESADALLENEMPSSWTQLKSKKAGAVRYYLYKNS